MEFWNGWNGLENNATKEVEKYSDLSIMFICGDWNAYLPNLLLVRKLADLLLLVKKTVSKIFRGQLLSEKMLFENRWCYGWVPSTRLRMVQKFVTRARMVHGRALGGTASLALEHRQGLPSSAPCPVPVGPPAISSGWPIGEALATGSSVWWPFFEPFLEPFLSRF